MRDLVALLSVVCAVTSVAAGVNVTHEEGVDFNEFRTYSWSDEVKPAARAEAQECIVEAVERELSAKGLRRVERGGTLLVKTVAYGEMEVVRRAGYSNFDRAGVGVITNDASSTTEGNIVVDLVDADYGKLVWRGVAAERMQGASLKKACKKIDKLVRRMFRDFPPE